MDKEFKRKIARILVIFIITIILGCIVTSKRAYTDLLDNFNEAWAMDIRLWDGENLMPDTLQFKKNSQYIEQVKDILNNKMSYISIPFLSDPHISSSVSASVRMCTISLYGDDRRDIVVFKNHIEVRTSSYIERCYFFKDNTLLEDMFALANSK